MAGRSNRELRAALGAYACAIVAEWAVWVAVVVYAYDAGGSTLAGITTVWLLIPALAAATFVGRIADGPRPVRALGGSYVLQATGYAGAALCAWFEAPAAAGIACVTLTLTALSYVRPASAVVVPGLVRTAGELTRANLRTGYCDTAGMLFGSLVAAALLAIDGPGTAFAVCAVLTGLAAAAVAPLARFEQAAPRMVGGALRGEEAHGTPRAGPGLMAGLRELTRRPGTAGLLAALTARKLLEGALDLLLVVVAVEQLHRGQSTAGTLSALFGAGAVAGGVCSAALIGRRYLAPTVIAALAVIAAALLGFGALTTLTMAAIALPLAGMGRAVLSIGGKTLLQRAAPQHALASVFTVLESLGNAGIVAGAVLAQVCVAAGGARLALVVVGALFVLVLLTIARGLVRVDAVADAPVAAIRQLRHLPIFAPLPMPALDAVARAAVEVSAAPGEVIVREGEPGDRYYAITGGHVDVVLAGDHIRTMARGSGFGEIALLAEVPRTATVIATDHVTLLAVDRTDFLTAVTGHDASADTAWSVARNWHSGLDVQPTATPG